MLVISLVGLKPIWICGYTRCLLISTTNTTCHNPAYFGLVRSKGRQTMPNHFPCMAPRCTWVTMEQNGLECNCPMSVAALQPPPQPFVAPHHTSATCLQSVTAFQPPTQPLMTPQNPFSMHAQAIAGPPLPTPPGYTSPYPAYPSAMPMHAATMQPPPIPAYYQYPRPWYV